MKKSTPPRYNCHRCGKLHNTGGFKCQCGFVRDPAHQIRLDDRRRIMDAWKVGRSEVWISQRFNCSDRTARQWKPLSMRKKSLITF